MTSILDTPFSFKNLDLPNRFVMAPMTRTSAPGGVPTDLNAAYYRRRAEGGVGLIITEGTFIDHRAAGYHTAVPLFYGAAALNGWKKVVDAVHAAGSKIMPQLWHVGRERRARPGAEQFYPHPDVVSVSADDASADQPWPYRALAEAEIADVIAAYASAARGAQAVGFDGVELHGAHGYLIDQFMRAQTNRRTDSYGSDRMRFAVEVVRAARAAAGPDFPIVFRFSQWTVRDYEAKLVSKANELEQLLRPLVEAGVDVFHASTRRWWEPAFEGSDLTLAGWTKKLTGKPVIAVGSIGLDKPFAGPSQDHIDVHGNIENLEAGLARGEFDLVAIGRALLSNPSYPALLRERASHFAAVTPEVRAKLL